MVLVILAVYRLLLLVTLIAASPWWLARMVTKGRYRAGLAGRLGVVPKALSDACSGDHGLGWIWLHAVSVGEVLAASQLVRDLRDAGYRVAVSTTTEAGQELAKKRFLECPVFYMPLDFATILARYFNVLQPRLMVTVESELWPNLIHACKTRSVPLAVVNARVSDRSFPRYMRLKGLWEPLLREVSLFLAQSEVSDARLVQMGVDAKRVRCSGNLKYDVRAGTRSKLTGRVASVLGPERLLLCGSTLPGEEEALLDVWSNIRASKKDAALMIAPRHPDRFEEVFRLIESRGFRALRCSALGDQQPAGETILLLDTVGDLASMYSLARVAFVGGSLVPKGGHNPLEPAQFGVPVVMGESIFNFREIVEVMLAGDGIRIVRGEQLGETVSALLRDDGGLGERGRRVFAGQTGATERTVSALLEVIRGGS